MDSSIGTQNSGTRKLFRAEKTVVDVNKDPISNLHESILGHILSFLPTIEAVHTSVLSRRWIDVWTFTTGLRFNDSLVCSGRTIEKERFVHFVNSVLLHFANSSIQSFSLCLTSYQYDSSQVSSWISSVLKRGIQKLHIQYPEKIFLSFHSLFSCTSLVQLVLQIRCNLRIPNFACLPNLQNLCISGIKLVSDHDSSSYSKDLILNFPVLKVFEAKGCEWSTMHNVSIQAPLLERFSITIWKSLSNESSKPAIKIFAPHLTEFCYEGDLEQDIILLSTSSISCASAVIVIDEDKKDRMGKFGFQLQNFLRQIHHVERLTLLFYKVLMNAKDMFTLLPAFGRLTCLQLNEVTGDALLNLLHSSPLLRTLVLLNGVSNLNEDVVLTSASVPHCFVSSLKVFEFKGFNVHKHELCLAKFVMENAAKLERMTISMAFWLRYSDIDMDEVKEEILSFPKCSKFVMVEFAGVNGS